jgi:hypothetical protein
MDPGCEDVVKARFATFVFQLLLLNEYELNHEHPIDMNLDQGVYVLKERYPYRSRPLLRRSEFPGGELRAEVRGRHYEYEYETWKEPGHKLPFSRNFLLPIIAGHGVKGNVRPLYPQQLIQVRANIRKHWCNFAFRRLLQQRDSFVKRLLLRNDCESSRVWHV